MKNNDDDNLNYHFPRDMLTDTYGMNADPSAALTRAGFATESQIALSEIFTERKRRLLKLGYQQDAE